MFQNASEEMHDQTVARGGENIIRVAALNPLKKLEAAAATATLFNSVDGNIPDCVTDERHRPRVQSCQNNPARCSWRHRVVLIIKIFHHHVQFVSVIVRSCSALCCDLHTLAAPVSIAYPDAKHAFDEIAVC